MLGGIVNTILLGWAILLAIAIGLICFFISPWFSILAVSLPIYSYMAKDPLDLL